MSIVLRGIQWPLKGKANFVTNGDLAPKYTVINSNRVHH